MPTFNLKAVAASTPNATPTTVANMLNGNSAFRNGVTFNIVPSPNGINAIQYGRNGAAPTADAPRYAVLFTSLGESGIIRLDRTTERRLQINANGEAVALDGTFDRYLDNVLHSHLDSDPETLAAQLTQQLTGVTLRVRRISYIGLNQYGQRKQMSTPTLEFANAADAARFLQAPTPAPQQPSL